MEKVYKITIELESTDEHMLGTFLHYVSEDIEEGRLKATQSVANGFVEGKVVYSQSERCEHCHGEGEIATDEVNRDGNIERGVGRQTCICKK